ncbi:Putative odorant receptor 10a [Papilio machaon]|uniref:Odorant receptor n=1 Tax=Papilio machaon TaxID=76193 RepID=A0A194QKY7_PAPMA|nr:Putative odorant receptor 10a [Papilio machaon]
MDEDYQKIYERHIKLGKLGQNCWVIIPVVLSSQFPMFAGACMIYENLKSDMGKRYMVHEMELKYIEDKQYETPYFEMLFACILLQCVILVPNFTGFDGSFCIATAHLQLKLKLMTNKLHRAFKDSKNNLQLEEKVKEVIRDHQEAFRFYNNLENMYGGWLLVVFLITSVVISLNLYQNSISEVIDPKYTLFVVSGVVHMYTPCYFASNLSKSGEDLCSDIYSVPWEECANPVVTKLLIFMIAKSQQPLHLTGKGMIMFYMPNVIEICCDNLELLTNFHPPKHLHIQTPRSPGSTNRHVADVARGSRGAAHTRRSENDNVLVTKYLYSTELGTSRQRRMYAAVNAKRDDIT